MKNVQIPYELFVSLLRYHLMEDDDCLNKIRQGLEQKLDSLVLHELYAKYKTAPTQEEREKAKQEYLEKRGVPDGFRWYFSFDDNRQERVTLLWIADNEKGVI